MLTKEPRTATIKVTSEKAKALVLDKASFDMILGPLEELNKRGRERRRCFHDCYSCMDI